MLGDAKLIGRDEDEADSRIAAHCSQEGVDSASELQVSAAAYGEAFEATHLAVDGEKVGKGLCGMVVAAVACVNNGDGAVEAGNIGSAFLGMAHCDYIRKAVDGFCGVGDALALGDGRVGGIGKADNMSAQLIHCRLKAESGAGGGLIEESCQLFAGALLSISIGMGDYILGGGNETVNFLGGEVENIYKVLFHFKDSLITCQSSSRRRDCCGKR